MPSQRLSSLRGAVEKIVETEDVMPNEPKPIIDWKPASTASRPGEERGVIAIIKPATGA
jgi:hypothetical protein